MTKKTLQFKDLKKLGLTSNQIKDIKGGKTSAPGHIISSGLVDWGEIDVRNETEAVFLYPVEKKKLLFLRF